MSPSASADSLDPAVFQRHLDAGDHRAAGEWLVAHCSRAVLGLCRGMVGDRSTAEDLAQDAFGRAFGALASFRGEASPRTWLLAIARNGCLDHLRRAARSPWVLPDEPDDGDSTASEEQLPVDQLSDRRDLERALASLTEGQRALVVLRFRHGLEYAELARVFGLKPGTVRMRVSRAIARMREALEPPEISTVDEMAAGPAEALLGALPDRSRGRGRREEDADPAPTAAILPRDSSAAWQKIRGLVRRGSRDGAGRGRRLRGRLPQGREPIPGPAFRHAFLAELDPELPDRLEARLQAALAALP